MEVLLHGGTQLNGWRSADVHQAILATFGLSATSYTLTQLRYDMRKMKAHGLLERIGRGYRSQTRRPGRKTQPQQSGATPRNAVRPREKPPRNPPVVLRRRTPRSVPPENGPTGP